MSTPSNAITLSVGSEMNLNENLVAFVQANYPAALLDTVLAGFIREQRVGDSNVAEWVLAPANASISTSARTEGDDTLTFDAWNPTSITMTLANVLASKAMTYDEWHTAARSLGDPLSNLMDSAMKDVIDVRERILFAAATGNTNTAATTAASTLGAAELRAAAFQLQALSAPGQMVFIGHTAQARDIVESYATSNAAGLVGRDGTPLSAVQGYVGRTIEGVEIYASANGLSSGGGRNGMLFTPGGLGCYQRVYENGTFFRPVLSTPSVAPGSIFDHRDQIVLSIYTAIAVDAVDQNKLVQVSSRS